MAALITLTDEEILARIDELRDELVRRGSLQLSIGFTSERMQMAQAKALVQLAEDVKNGKF